MKKYSKFIVIGMFCWLIMPLSSIAAQWATIVADKAVIYADPEMTAPIGFVKKGKKVRIGEVAKNRSQVFPIIVSGKITYIKIQDIQTSDKLLKLQSATERLKEQSKQKRIYRKLALVATSYLTELSVEESYVGDDARTAIFTGFGMRGYIHNLINGNGWRFTIDVVTFEEDSESLSVAELTTDYFVDVIASKGFDLSIFAGVTLVPYAEYQVGSLFTENGYGLGAGIGAEIAIKLGSTLSLHFDSSYQYTKLSGFELPEALEIDNFSPVLNGMKASAAIALSY